MPIESSILLTNPLLGSLTHSNAHAHSASSTLEKRKFEINFVQYIWPFMTSLATLLVFLCVSLVKLAVTAFGMLIYRPCHSLADSLLKLPKRYLVIGVVALVSTLALWWNLYAVSSATKWLIHGVGGGMGSLGIPAWLSLLSSASSKKKSLANPPRSSPPSAPKKSNHHHSPNATPTDASPSSSSSALESIINRLSVLESSVNIDSSRESNDVNELKQLVQRMSEMFESIEQRSLFLQDMVDNQSKSYGQLESSMHSRVEDLSKKLHSLDQVVEEGLITLAKEKIASSSPSNMLSSEEKREDLIQIIRETIEVDVNMKQRISDIMESHIKGIKDEIKSLNDANVGRIIDKSLLRYSADVIAKPDYALESAGGAIISELTSSTFCSVWQKESWRIFGVGSTQCKGYGRPSRVAISNDMSVGKCWSMNGELYLIEKASIFTFY